MFIQTALVTKLQARAVELELANRVIKPEPHKGSCPGCYRPRLDVSTQGHGRGCYFGPSR